VVLRGVDREPVDVGGEQVADGGGQDSNGLAGVDPAGADLFHAGVDEGDAGRDQPAGRQVGAERAIGTAALHQRTEGLVRGLVGAGHRLRAQLFGDCLGHRCVAGQVPPGHREHPLQRLDGRPFVRAGGVQRCHGLADRAFYGRLQQCLPGREVGVHRDP